VYRRTEKEMPARVEEVAHAKEEGIVFHFLASPVRFLGNGEGHLAGMECIRYELGEPDDSGRRRPVAIEGSDFRMEVDTAIVAIGNDPNPLIRRSTPGLQATDWGTLIIDDSGETSVNRVFAGGDIVTGSATVILAMGQGRQAAASINRLLAGDDEIAR